MKDLVKVDEKEKKEVVRSTRFTKSELQEVEKAARRLGLSVNRYMRAAILTQAREINERRGK